jgi:hypothetical protein
MVAFGVRLSELRCCCFLDIAIGIHVIVETDTSSCANSEEYREAELPRRDVAGEWIFERNPSFGVLSDGQPSFPHIIPTRRPRKLVGVRYSLWTG